jgi:hypothetical protein
MKRWLRHVRRVGMIGLLVWMYVIGMYLSVRWRDGSWRWSDLGKYTAMVLLVSYTFGGSRESESELPYLICTSCGKKNTDPSMADPAGWQCGHCHQETLVRVGQRRETTS